MKKIFLLVLIMFGIGTTSNAQYYYPGLRDTLEQHRVEINAYLDSLSVHYDSIAAVRSDVAKLLNSVDLWYGVQWDVTSSNPVVTQIGNSTYQTTLPVHTAIKYAVIEDDKSINYYLDETDFTKKEDGTASDLTGADGQAMMIIPKYYEKYEQDGNIVRYKVSPYELSGFTATDSVAIALFEGTYTASGDTLQSVINDTAKTSQTRAQFRAAAAKRGTGWSQIYYDAYRYLTMLYMVEYASWDSQDSLGAGASDASSGDWNTYNSYNPVFKTGKYVSYGAHTGSIADTVPAFPSGTDTLFTQQAYYRGVENVFGHIWKWVDGLNIYEHRVFTSSNPSQFADNDSTNYSLVGVAPDANGYISRLIYGSIIPQSVGGSSSTYMADYYYQSSGWRVALFGGNLSDGSYGGLWVASFKRSSGYSYAYIGSRLCLKF